MEKQAFVDHFIGKDFDLHIDIYIYMDLCQFTGLIFNETNQLWTWMNKGEHDGLSYVFLCKQHIFQKNSNIHFNINVEYDDQQHGS